MYIPVIMGLVSSLHCVGMCGPLVLMMQGGGRGKGEGGRGKGEGEREKGEALWNALLYNLGRVTTYAALGLVFGLVGRSFVWFGWQQKISVALGIIVLLVLILPTAFTRIKWISGPFERMMAFIRGRMSTLLFGGRPGSSYAFGLLNGLLPCGMVYMAMAAALASGTPLGGASFMALFGLGTLPGMWALAAFGSLAGMEFRALARKIFPALMALVAILLILRGLNLDIPYLSPSLQLSPSEAVHCHD